MVECLDRMEGGKCMASLSVSNHKSAYAAKQKFTLVLEPDAVFKSVSYKE